MVTPAVVTEPVQQVEPAVVPAVSPGQPVAASVDTVPVPATTPSTVPATVPLAPQTTPGISEVETLRRQLALAEADRQQLEADRQAEATRNRLTEEARQVHRDAQARGLSEEDANWMAQRHYDLAQRVHQEREAVRREQQIMQGRINAAISIGQEYGISPGALMHANTPGEMRAIGEREKENASLRARLSKLEQGRVQPQTLNSTNIGGVGGVAITLDNIDGLYMAHERQHPNMPNPYEAQYRKLLGMG